MSGPVARHDSRQGRLRAMLRGERGMVLSYAVVAVFLLRNSLRPGRAFSFRDVYLFWMPSIEGFVRAVGGGEWPLWDPVFNFGKPLLADPGMQLAYPLTWLNMLVLPQTYYQVFLLAHLTWAGWGAYRLASRWGLPKPAAWSAGAFFACSGPVLSALSLWHHFAGTTWLPWVLLALERLLERPGPRRAALLGAAAAGQALAGSADLCLMTGVVCALRVVAGWRRSGMTPRLAWATVAVAVAAGLAAVQWWPTLATLAASTRASMGRETFGFWSLHPARLVELVLPLPTSGFALEPELRQRLFEGRESFLATLHPGVGALGLAALGLLVPGPRRRLRLGLWLAFTVLVLAALGRYGFVYPLLERLPGLDRIRYPQKFLLPASFFLAAAAACGVAVWLEPWSEAQRRTGRRVGTAGALVALLLLAGATALWTRPALLEGIVVGDLVESAAAVAGQSLAVSALTALVVAVLVVVRAARVEAPRPLGFAVVGLSLAQLLQVSAELCSGAPSALVTERPSLIAPLLQERTDVRLQVAALPPNWVEDHVVRSPLGWDGAETRALGRLETLQAPTPARWGIDGAYWGTFTGQEPLVFSNLTTLVHRRRDALGTRLLRMGGVTHLVSVEEQPYPGLTETASVESVFDDPIRLFRVTDPAPRAFAVDGVLVADEPDSYGVALWPGFDHRRSAILPEGSPRQASEGFRADVRTLWRRTASVGLEAELSGDGILVLLEAWDPGWTVEVDGASRPLLRADLIFRGVALGGGRHRVVFRYRPREVVLGFWTSVGALVAATALASRREA